jgi:hypothetical protein
MVNALGAYVQSVFANPMNAMSNMNMGSSGGGQGGGGQSSGGASNGIPNNPSSGGDHNSLVGFYFRGSLVPLIHIYQPSTPKPQL